ncbi:MAG: CDP-diacylglycerol diphosphatase [Reyranellaceae bacterium]
MTRTRAAAALMLALGLAVACTPSAPGSAPGSASGPAPAPAGESCSALPKPPDTLRTLARCCAESLASNPSCRQADPRQAWVLLKDNSPRKPLSWLIVPAAPVTGIEDPAALRSPVADFFQDGFALAQRFPGRPAADTALAVNSQPGRTQNQLHIHISCVRPAVKQALDAVAVPAWPAAPRAVALPPKGSVYEAVRVDGLAGPLSPFRLVQERPGVRNGGAAAMGEQTIAVVGTATPGQYIVLNRRGTPDRPAEAEELLDQRCNEAN